jgi:hypothetical protein
VLDGGEGDLEGVAAAVAAGRDVELVEARIDPAWIPDTQALVREKLPGVQAYWELVPGRGLRGAVAAVREARAGAKIRCGGESVPPVEAVAAFVVACRDAGVRFKATAGLHHPIRDGIMHGFLNLLAAALFAQVEGAAERDLVPVLREEDENAFKLTPKAFTFRGRPFHADEIAATRERLFIGYGSCSFSEPVDDLRSLGML